MSRGFRSKANKARDAALEVLRVRYLSAIAWRRASWLAELHAFEPVMFEPFESMRRAEAASREESEARRGFIAWRPLQAACVLWGVTIGGVLVRDMLAAPVSTSHDKGNPAIA